MNRTNPSAPPRFFLAFFRWFCDPAHAEDIEGDLLESFHRNAERLGHRKAKRLFAWEVMLLFRPSLIRINLRNYQSNLDSMKKSDWIWMVALHLLLVASILSPFLPGPPNRFVVGLSALGQSAAFLGALLMPVGALWLFLDFRQRSGASAHRAHRYVLSLIAAGLVTVPCLLGLLYTFLLMGIWAGSGISMAFCIILYHIWGSIRKLRASSVRFNLVPVYLLTVPVLSLLMRMYVLEPVSTYSRGLAMDRGEAMIGLIDDYHAEKGRYPSTLVELEKYLSTSIPGSPVMGISELRYHVDQQGFNVSFSQWQHMAVDEEIVLFSRENLAGSEQLGFDYKLDKHRIKGAYASFDAKRENWRYYWCD